MKDKLSKGLLARILNMQLYVKLGHLFCLRISGLAWLIFFPVVNSTIGIYLH